jgi:hypothetical protein
LSFKLALKHDQIIFISLNKDTNFLYIKTKNVRKAPNGWYSKGGELLLENQIPQQQLTVNGYLVISI